MKLLGLGKQDSSPWRGGYDGGRCVVVEGKSNRKSIPQIPFGDDNKD